MSENLRFTSPEDQEKYNHNLSIISDVLQKYAVESSVVGGAALKAHSGEMLEARRANGSIVDFDAVAFGPDSASIDSALSELQTHKKAAAVFPELGIEPVVFADQSLAPSLLVFLSTMRVDSQNRTFLEYGKISVEVNPETLVTKTVPINEVPFSVYSRKTILARYHTRGGYLKPKDESKIAALQKNIEEDPRDELPDSFFQEYYLFAEQIKKLYWYRVMLFKAFWSLDKLTNGKISGSGGAVYDSIKLFRTQQVRV